MLPNLYWSTIPLGAITIQVWGLCVALGMAVALYVAKRRAEKRKLSGELVLDVGFWIILGSLLGSRIFFVLTEWQMFSSNWLDVLKIWQGGMSISGGFLGAAVAAVCYFKYKKVSFWEYTDVIVSALPLGVGIGRLGCAFIFDHPGTVTNFFLGEVYYGDGLVRHNHGLYLSIDGFILATIFAFMFRKYNPKTPVFTITYLIWEGIVRLVLDHWRILDSVYFYMTAAQWMGLAMVIGGVILFGQRQNIRKLMSK